MKLRRCVERSEKFGKPPSPKSFRISYSRREVPEFCGELNLYTEGKREVRRRVQRQKKKLPRKCVPGQFQGLYRACEGGCVGVDGDEVIRARDFKTTSKEGGGE